MLTNELGSFYLWTEQPYSKFCGLHFNLNGIVYKCLEAAVIPEKLESSTDTYPGILNQRDGLLESVYMPKKRNAIAFRYSHATDVKLVFDVKRFNDWDEWGRNYSISVSRGCIVLKYFKKGYEDYTVYVAIKTRHKTHELLNKFVMKEYSYDNYRNSSNKRYVYDSLVIYSSFFTIAMSENKHKAVNEAKSLYRHYDMLYKFDKRRSLKTKYIVADDQIASAFKNAQISIARLTNNYGIYAGLPWFCQVWSRDELISMVNLIYKDTKHAKSILMKYFDCVNESGRLPAILPDKGLNSADAAGWLALRIQQLIEFKKNIFKVSEKKKIVEFFDKLLLLNQKNVNDRGLVFSNTNETWMDTNYNDDGRKGYCIEIQALHMRILELLYLLTNGLKYKNQLDVMKSTVYDLFYDEKKKVLYDHLNVDLKPSIKVRPNLFIAYYVFPDFLSKGEWEHVFDHSLKHLWLNWGGLSSIDKKIKDFVSDYTGENNKSYHRGDSWYFLNCIAAIAMHKVDSKKYKSKIDKIIKACSKESMNNGVIGSIAEVSSASHQNGVGCLSQAWSLAMFIELIGLVYD
ncbi:MAG: amylo-alpha-1,6-glucosidase [Candidatus Woesearchaeota archaeon]